MIPSAEQRKRIEPSRNFDKLPGKIVKQFLTFVAALFLLLLFTSYLGQETAK